MQDLTPRFPFAWLYDKNGNRQSETRNAGTMAYAYSPTGSNWLLQKGSDSRSKTANGNTASISGVASFSYDGFNRLATSVTASETTTYSYNALGERIKKINQNGLSAVFHYGTNGELLYEKDQVGNTKEYVWLDQRPLARIDNGTSIYYYHVDHLGTPQAMTNSAGAVVWKGDYEPFGKATIKVSTIENNLRLPGQYFDRETGMHYNYYRSCYDPTTGRYCEADPIGIAGGLNVYGYGKSNPLKYTDPTGQYVCYYSIDFHQMVCYSDQDPSTPSYDSENWGSGSGDCYNNAACYTQKSKGPLPPGCYRVGGSPKAPRKTNLNRRDLIPLQPIPPSRDGGFQFHHCGNNSKGPSNKCSEGCAVTGKDPLSDFYKMLDQEPGSVICVNP